MAEPWMTEDEMRNYADAMKKNNIPAEAVAAQLAKLNECDQGAVQEILNKGNNVKENDLTEKKEKTLEGFVPIDAFNREKRSLEERMVLYKKGLTDKEIAKKQGVGDAAIWQWRKKLGLAANKPAVSGHARRREAMEANRVHKKDEERAALYREGLTDEEIAEKQGVKPAAVTFLAAEEWPASERKGEAATPLEKMKPMFTLERTERMSVATLAELLRKVAEGWPDAEIEVVNESADADRVTGVSLRIDYDIEGKEQLVSVLVFVE